MNYHFPIPPGRPSTQLTALFPECVPTLATVSASLANDHPLSGARRRDLVSSLRRVAAVLRLEPAQIPADPAWLRARLAKIEPALLGLKAKTWANVVSNALAALTETGVTRKGWRSSRLSPEWQTLWNKIEDTRLKIGLGSFVRFCSRQNIGPTLVSDQTVEQFAQALRDGVSLRKSPERALYYLTTSWNKARDRIEDWPQSQLMVPRRRVLFSPKTGQLPVSLRQDIERYTTRMRCLDPLADDAPPRALAAATLAHRERQIRRFFGELTESGVAPGSLPDLCAMVQPEMVRRGLGTMVGRKQGRSGMIYGMAYMLVTIAKYYARLPPEKLAVLKQYARNLKPERQGMTAKNRKRLRQFEDSTHLWRILQLPQTLLQDANSGRLSPKRSALLAETAIAIELLIMTMLRIKNLAHLHLEENIFWSRSTAEGVCHLVVEPDEVKNGEPRSFELDGETVSLLRAFVRRHRPVLAPHSSRWLFGRRDGKGPVDESVLGNRISRTVRQRLGLVVNPHLFRGLGAMIYLKKHPGAYEVVRRMLGHKQMSTTIEAYTGLETASAARHFDQTIREAREFARPIHRGRR